MSRLYPTPTVAPAQDAQAPMPSPEVFDRMFVANDDPWQFRTRWYEQRKRALTLAALPHARYRRGFEPGCANGELSAALASRCDRLLVTDGSAQALLVARQRLAGLPGVELQQMQVPGQWPAGRFDLVVLSELLYYLQPARLVELIGAVRAGLNPGAVVLACHWRHPIPGCTLNGDAVHQMLGAQLKSPTAVQHEEADFLLQVWCADGRSVAHREGLV